MQYGVERILTTYSLIDGTGNSYFLGINSNDFFLKDNKIAFTLWLNVSKVTANRTYKTYFKKIDVFLKK